VSGFSSIITQIKGEEAAQQFLAFIQKREVIVHEVTLLHRQLKQDGTISLKRDRMVEKTRDDMIKSLILKGVEVCTKMGAEELRKRGHEGWGQLLSMVSEGLRDFRTTTFKPEPQPPTDNSLSGEFASFVTHCADLFMLALKYVAFSLGRLPAPPDPKDFGLKPHIAGAAKSW